MKKKSFSKAIGMFLCFCFIAVNIIAVAPIVVYADEYDDIRTKWLETINGGTSFSTTDPAFKSRIDSIGSYANSRWSNLNKASDRTYLFSSFQDIANSSHVTETYNSLRSMALGYSTRGSSVYGDTALRDDIISAMQWLIDQNWYNSSRPEVTNWWDWEIGSPMAAVDILCMLYNDIETTSLISDYAAAIAHFTPDVTKCNYGQVSTGANRAWVCGIWMKIGILEKNNSKIAAARDATNVLFDYVTKGDGIYADGSFIQHSKHSYTGGYGIAQLKEVSVIIYLLGGTTWQITDPDLPNIHKWVYDGFEPLIFDGGIFDNVKGQEISRQGTTPAAVIHTLINTLAKLAGVVPSADANYYKSLIKAYVNTRSNGTYASNSINTLYELIKVNQIMSDSSVIARANLETIKQYNSMDRVAQLRPSYGFSVGMFSKRTENFELMNGENEKGWHYADGWTQIIDADENQYIDWFLPTVNAYRMSGTTVEQNTTVAADVRSTASWVGGTDILGKYGVTGMQLATPGQTLTAKKSWFMFDDEIVCLGSGITATDGKVVETVVENRKLSSSGDNALTVNGTAKPASLGWSETMSGVNWAHLAGNVSGSDIGYYFPDGNTTVNGLRQERTGAWADVGTGGTTSYKKNYMELWLDHGSNPTAGSYNYVLLPGYSSSQTQVYNNSPEVTVLENSTGAQAVKETTLNMIGANFWNDSSKTVDIISCNKKASVMIKENPGQDIEVSVCDPTQLNTGTIDITINKSVASVISKDNEITVTQLSPTIKFTVNVNGAKGKSFKVKFNIPTTSLFNTSIAKLSGNYQIDTTLKNNLDENRNTEIIFALYGQDNKLLEVHIQEVNLEANGSTTIQQMIGINPAGNKIKIIAWNSISEMSRDLEVVVINQLP